MKKFMLPLFLAGAVLFNSCSNDDDAPTTSSEQKDGIISSLDDPDFDKNDLKGSVQTNLTLSESEYILSGELSVEKGYTLTINPGTTVKAIAGGTNVYLVVQQGAKIDAQGTASNPIRFTSNAGLKRAGDWGGIILAGYAKTNVGETAVTEVGDITYGGNNDQDNSGILKYVIAEYTGARIGGEQEFNGITFYAVGSGTVVENIAVMNGDDDGIEFFGGTVNVTNALVINAKDDMFDWAEGYTGTINNAYGVREAGYNDVTEDPRGIEGDSNKDNPAAQPVSNPTINSITLVNKASAVKMADAIKVRRGSGATITNALITNTGDGYSDIIDLEDGSGNAIASTNINYSVSSDLDGTDVKNAPNATLTLATSNTGADTAPFAFTGYSF